MTTEEWRFSVKVDIALLVMTALIGLVWFWVFGPWPLLLIGFLLIMGIASLVQTLTAKPRPDKVDS